MMSGWADGKKSKGQSGVALALLVSQ